MTCCSAVHYQCSCTQTIPWLSSCYRPEKRDWFLHSSLCSYHWGEARQLCLTLTLCLCCWLITCCRLTLPLSLYKKRKALHETEGILCFYTLLSHYFYSPVKLHRFPRCPSFPETTVALICRTICPAALPVTLKFQSAFPCSAAAFHHTMLAKLPSLTVSLLGLQPGSTAPEKVRVKSGPYSSSHACGAVSPPSYCSPVSSGQAPNVCTSSGSAHGRPPEARAEC